MASAHVGALGDVDDTQATLVGVHVSRFEERRPPLPEVALRAQLTFALLPAADRRLGVLEDGAGLVHDTVARLPCPQGPVDVLVAHRIVRVERADPVDQLTLDVHARSGDGKHGVSDVCQAVIERREAVVVVEPFGCVWVSMDAGVLDPPVRVQQPRSDNPHFAALRIRGVLEALEPALLRLDVGIEEHDVRVALRALETAVGVAGEAEIPLPRDHVNPVDLPQLVQFSRRSGVIANDDSDPTGWSRLANAAHRTIDVGSATERRNHHRHVTPVPGKPARGP